MKEIIEIVDRYINKTDTNYSIMINGVWGSGKTHFVLNDLKQHVENLKGYDNKPYKLIHISLNGLNKLEWITEQVILARLPLNMASRVGYGITKSVIELFGRESLQKASLFTAEQISNYSTTLFDFHDCVIVFDDLERIDPDLKIESVLGYINNNFIEHHKLKIIFVANTMKLTFEKPTNFSEIQEKSIDRIIEYKQDFNTMLMSYVKSFLAPKLKFANVLKYIEKDFDEIIRMINIANCKNLRTIRFVFENFSTVYQSYNIHVDDKISRAIFMFVLTISQEFKEGKLPSSENSDQEILKLKENYSILRRLEEKKKKKNDQLSYSEEFYGKYLYNTRVEWKYFESIFNLVVNGVLNNKLFIKELNNYTILPDDWDSQLNLLLDYYSLEIDEVAKVVKKVLSYASLGKYLPTRYDSINNLVKEIASEKYVELSDDYTLTLILGLEKSLEVRPDYFSTFNYSSMQFLNIEYEEMTEFQRIIQRETIKFDQKIQDNNVDEFFNALSDNNINFYTTSIWRRIDSNIEFLTTIPTQNFVGNLLKLSNKNLSVIMHILHEKIIRISNAGSVYYGMKSFLVELASELEKRIHSSELDRLKLNILNQIVIKLNESIEHLETTKKN